MNEETLRRQLQRIPGDEPSTAFVDTLRERLMENRQPVVSRSWGDEPTVLDLTPGGNAKLGGEPERSSRPRILWVVAAAAALLVGIPFLIRAITTGESELETATTTEARQVGEAWLRSIVDGDRVAFGALHDDGFETDDTLMGFSEEVGLLTPARVGDLYYGGFDALQAAIAIDGDVIRANGCEDTDDRLVRCSFTATMIGTAKYTYTVTVELEIEDRLITALDFSTTTDPADFRSVVQEFLEQEGTDEDRSCLTLGFNTVGCGEHESDFVTRYAAYYEATVDS